MPASGHDQTDYFEQSGFSIKFGWGPNGLRRLAPDASAVVIVDVLSFSTAVDVALGRGATVLPYRWHDGSEQEYGVSHNALVAVRSPAEGKFSLRPSSLDTIDAGSRIVLPSPNGSTLAFGAIEAGADNVYLGSIRNAEALARHIAETVWRSSSDSEPGHLPGKKPSVAVIASGERWRGDTGPLRPAVEDLYGAGAVMAALDQLLARTGLSLPTSPEARTAIASFNEASSSADVLLNRLQTCGSGRELIDRGHAADVVLAAQFGVSEVVAKLVGSEIIDLSKSGESLDSTVGE